MAPKVTRNIQTKRRFWLRLKVRTVLFWKNLIKEYEAGKSLLIYQVKSLLPLTWRFLFLHFLSGTRDRKSNPKKGKEKHLLSIIKRDRHRPASVAQGTGHCPRHREVAGQGTCPGCGLDPWQGACRRQALHVAVSHWYLTPLPRLTLPLFLKTDKNQNKTKTRCHPFVKAYVK